MSIVLLCAALYGLMRAAMLCCIPANRCANRVLAALLVVLALYTAPYIIGYAGYYDAYPWLSFAPYNMTLAIGPLLYLYLAALAAGGDRMPPCWGLHLLPAFLQCAYYCTVFAQPLAFKNDWDARVHVPLVDPLETAGLLVSLAVYWSLALRHLRRQAPAQQEWVRNFLIATGLTAACWLALVGAELAWSGLSYFQRFPFYMLLAIVVCYLGTEGYRQGRAPVAAPAAVPAAPDLPRAGIEAPAASAATAATVAAPSQAELGERWRSVIAEAGWWRDPDLSLSTLARRLGTNTTALSRAFNEGLGLNFNEVLNRMRVEAVAAALDGADAGKPVLDIALAEGFNSKASFNRAFKHYMGETPTAYRRRIQGRAAPLRVSTSS